MNRPFCILALLLTAACAPYRSNDLAHGPPPVNTQNAASTAITAGATPSAQTLPAAAGFGGQILLSSGSGTATLTLSTNPPSGVPPFPTHSSIFAFLYLTLQAASSPFSLSAMPAFNITLPSTGPFSVPYYVSEYANGNWTQTNAFAWGSLTQPMACVSGSAPPVSLQSGQSLTLAIWTDAVLPTPTPGPNYPPPCPQSAQV